MFNFNFPPALKGPVLKERRIGLYGGSFDPVHNGHLNLALEMAEAHLLDEVWFCPAALNPHKEQCFVEASHRYNMLSLALSPIPYFNIIDLELSRQGPSYTIDTIRELLLLNKDEHPYTLFLILGKDVIPTFFKWKDAESIVRLTSLLIGTRGEEVDMGTYIGGETIRQAIITGFTPTRVMEISSSEIRSRLKKKLYCGHLLPAKVLDYIVSHDLY